MKSRMLPARWARRMGAGLMAGISVLAGCLSPDQEGTPVPSAYRVALILDRGGKDDRSFNSAAYQGLMRVKKEPGYFTKYVEATNDSSFEPTLRRFARKKFDLILAIGISQVDALLKVAGQFPNQKFAIFDGEALAPNIRSVLFAEHEGSYLVGLLAAMTARRLNRDLVVGFIGGMEIPLIKRFQMGYAAGVRSELPTGKVLVNFVGVTPEAWSNPAKAKEIAVAQYEGGAQVIFVAAGASGGGVFDAAEEKGRLAIGVDSNQNWIKPGIILTSMIKKVDEAIYQVCHEARAGTFVGGVTRLGLANHGVDYALDEYNSRLVTPEMKERLEQAKAQIIAGELQVPDFYRTEAIR